MSDNSLLIGTVVKAISGFYYVSDNDSVYECKARGNFRHTKVSPIVGDRVEFISSAGKNGVIDKILPRKNCLARPVVANVDKVIIVSSFENPAPDTYLIDRLSAICIY
ncbi:MAG: GTPase RsgA, partial [Clostridia bacterium]|nr:GTPase RsgA [Clostridia bacterium]